MNDSKGKRDIIDAIRGSPCEAVDLPELTGAWTTYDDRQRQFVEVLESVGGRAVAVAGNRELNAWLERLPVYRDAGTRCSLVSGVGTSSVDIAAIEDPRSLDNVEFCIAPGSFAVAENGAVWVTDDPSRHRAVYFLAQHLALVVPAREIIDNMHQAYDRLEFPGAGFGVFISGPSKTADIEQSLVIGAHGPRSLTVFLLSG